MSEAEGSGGFAPPSPKPKSFQVFWSDNDRPVSVFENVTGSQLNGNLLILMSHNIERIVNTDEVRLILIRDE